MRRQCKGSKVTWGGSYAVAAPGPHKTREEDKMKPNFTVGVLVCLLLGSALVFAGCAETVATSPSAPPPSASQMLGTWVLNMTWVSAGQPPSSARVELKGDGTLSGASSFFGTLSGTWSVSGASYIDSISSTLRMVTISHSGTVSGNTISGSFNSDAGSGTFQMTKQ